MGERPIVTLYGRAGCHLCGDALVQLRKLAPALGFAVESIDIESDDDLLRRYIFEIPVVALGAIELARAPISPTDLEDALRTHLALRS